MVSLLGKRRQRRHVNVVSLEIGELGNGTVIERIESTIDREDEEDLREFARGCHFFSLWVFLESDDDFVRRRRRNWLGSLVLQRGRLVDV